MRCDMETCQHWTGHGCACDVLDIRRRGQPCPLGPHRGPEGPNEDTGMCPECWKFSFEMRPEGETYGEHLPDCSLPIRHESYCQPGGTGHPPTALVRGYWPPIPTDAGDAG